MDLGGKLDLNLARTMPEFEQQTSMMWTLEFIKRKWEGL